MKSYLHCTKKTRSCVAKLVYYSIEAVGCTMVCNQNPKTMVGCSIQNLQTTYYVVVDGHLRVPLRWLSVLFAFAPLRVSPFLFVVSKSNKPKKNESDWVTKTHSNPKHSHIPNKPPLFLCFLPWIEDTLAPIQFPALWLFLWNAQHFLCSALSWTF